MRMTDEEVRALWQEGSERPPSECLTDGAWARLLAKDAAADERMRAAEHLALCAACADVPRPAAASTVEAELNRRCPSRPPIVPRGGRAGGLGGRRSICVIRWRRRAPPSGGDGLSCWAGGTRTRGRD
jgi:hypothetical protein